MLNAVNKAGLFYGQSVEQAFTVVDTGHGEGAAWVSNYVTSLMATAPEMLKNVSGIDLIQITVLPASTLSL